MCRVTVRKKWVRTASRFRGRTGTAGKGKERMSFNPIDVYVGNRVKVRRKTLRLTQQDLAKALGLTFQQVQKYERGANRISASKLFMIAGILDVSISYFFDGVEDEDIDVPGGFSEDAGGFDPKAVQDVLNFASSTEGIELNRAFSNIRDAKTRKLLVMLFESVADAP